MMTRIAVIIPCYNASAFIERCLLSVFAQNSVETEVICVDDGSTDNTREIIKQVGQHHKRTIKLIKQANGGAGKARNTGLAEATSEYVQFLDADDELLSGKLAHQLKMAAENNGPDLIAAPYLRVSLVSSETVPVEEDAWVGLIRGRLGCTCSNLFRRESVITAGGWSETYKSSQEAELMFRMLKRNMKTAIDSTCLTRVHIRSSDSVSTREPEANLVRYFQLRKDILEYLRSADLLTKERRDNVFAIMLGTLIMLYKINPELAVCMYNEQIKGRISAEAVTPISKLYLFICRLIGFKQTQRLFLLFRK